LKNGGMMDDLSSFEFFHIKKYWIRPYFLSSFSSFKKVFRMLPTNGIFENDRKLDRKCFQFLFIFLIIFRQKLALSLFINIRDTSSKMINLISL
jgi:hypothetical protein